MPITDTSIQLTGVSKVFGRKRGQTLIAVDNLNLTAHPGEVLGFLGTNGAGKSTSIKMMCGLVRPTTGEIILNGFNLLKNRKKAIKQVGVVLEGTRNVYWRLTAWENLMYFAGLKGLPRGATKQQAQKLLTDLELWDRKDDKVRHFSRGMQQKVAIACALVPDPPIVLLDEPTLGLDVQSAHTVKDWMVSLARDNGKTVLVTTHRLDIAQEVCDRVAVMRSGRLISDTSVDELLSQFRTNRYDIRVDGRLNGTSSFFPHMTITEDGTSTILTGELEGDQAVYSVVDEIRSAGLSLVSVTRREPDLEEAFIRLTDEKKPG